MCILYSIILAMNYSHHMWSSQKHDPYNLEKKIGWDCKWKKKKLLTNAKNKILTWVKNQKTKLKPC